MLVVMDRAATSQQIEHVCDVIRHMELTPHPLPGVTRTAIGITGNISAVDPRSLEVLPGVLELIRVTKPYKLASRDMHPDDTYIRLEQATIGPGHFTMIAGPCSVEKEETVLRTADFLMEHGVRLLRAGAFKPRTSPYAIQGLGLQGLAILDRVRAKTGIGICHGVDGYGKCRRGRRRGGHYSNRYAQHAEFQFAQTRRPHEQADIAQTWNVGHSGRMVDGGRIRHGGRQLRCRPLRARRPHLFRPQPQYARSVCDSSCEKSDCICRFLSIRAMARASAIMCRRWRWRHWPQGPMAY